MSWVNSLQDGFAYIMVDGAGNQGQIYIPTKWFGFTGQFRINMSDLLIGSPVSAEYRINEFSRNVFTPDTSNINQNLKTVWRWQILDTEFGTRVNLDMPGADPMLLPAGTDIADLGVEPFLQTATDIENIWLALDNNTPKGTIIVEQCKLVRLGE